MMLKNTIIKENMNKVIPELAGVRLALSGSSTHAVGCLSYQVIPERFYRESSSTQLLNKEIPFLINGKGRRS